MASRFMKTNVTLQPNKVVLSATDILGSSKRRNAGREGGGVTRGGESCARELGGRWRQPVGGWVPSTAPVLTVKADLMGL